MKRIVHVVAQTHWDREWYMPHQTSVARLLVVMQHVATMLERGALSSFLFDGQTAALEDLLREAEPALAERVKKLLKDGRIVVGPWYVMADEFLVSGESLLRNLEIGISDSREYGREQRVGYLPDTFGHIAQMPQILREFGLDCAVVWRGVDLEASEFWWVAPNGSSVNALFLTQGYYQHPLNVADWKVAVNRYLEQIAPKATTSQLLLTQGGDHLQPVSQADDRLQEFNRTQNEYQLRWSSLEDTVAATFAEVDPAQLQQVRGELRQNKQAFVLPDVLSTRRYLKHLHQLVEDRLLGETEPLLAKFASAESYPTKYLDQCWRLLIQQQAHDSICGCSADEVHREMETRFVQLDQRLDALKRNVLSEAGFWNVQQHEGKASAAEVFSDDVAFTLFNPLPQARELWQSVDLFLRGERISYPTLKEVTREAETKLLDFELLSVESTFEFHSPLDEFPDRIVGHRYRLAVRARLAGFATLACSLADDARGGAGVGDSSAKRSANQIENQALRLVHEADGTITLTSLSSGFTVSRAIAFSHEHDVGDSYNFCPTPEHKLTIQYRFELISVERYRTTQAMRLRVVMPVPAQIESDRASSSTETVENVGALTLTLHDHDPQVRAQLKWTNRSKDQRTRLLLPWLQGTRELTRSDSAFNIDERSVRFASYPSAISRSEMPVVVHPSQSIVVGGGWWLAHRAMQEHEALAHEGQRSLGITLVRSVGWMSRRDLVTRGVGAGPDFDTPDAQCLRDDSFDFCFGLAGDSDRSAEVEALVAAQSLRRPLLLLRGHPAHGRRAVDIGNSAVQISSTRMRGDALEIRLWNPTGEIQRTHFDPQRWVRVFADGSASREPINVIEPHSICTLRASLASFPLGGA